MSNLPKIASFQDYKDRDYLIVVPSKGRGNRISQLPKIVPNAVLYVNEEELEDYASTPLPVIPHQITKGVAAVRNGIINGCRSAGIKYCCQVDDDTARFHCYVGNRGRDLDADQIEAVIANDCQILEDIGAMLLTFSTANSIIEYTPSAPYIVGAYIARGGFILNTESGLMFKEFLIECEDFDLALQCAMKYKFMLQDHRIARISGETNQEGGCNAYRNRASQLQIRQYLLNTWGKYIDYGKNSHGNLTPKIKIKYKNI